jgi:hypothetical protein
MDITKPNLVAAFVGETSRKKAVKIVSNENNRAPDEPRRNTEKKSEITLSTSIAAASAIIVAGVKGAKNVSVAAGKIVLNFLKEVATDIHNDMTTTKMTTVLAKDNPAKSFATKNPPKGVRQTDQPAAKPESFLDRLQNEKPNTTDKQL